MDLQEALPAMPLETIKKQVTIVHSALEACKQKEAIVIATEWKEFKEIDWQAVYDGRFPSMVEDEEGPASPALLQPAAVAVGDVSGRHHLEGQSSTPALVFRRDDDRCAV